MTEKKGHFDKGVWVEEPVVPEKKEIPIDTRLEDATKAVIAAMDNAAKVTHDLVATEEGKKHIEKTIKDASEQVEKTYSDILARVKAEMEKASRPKK
jgi:hypothetical protein